MAVETNMLRDEELLERLSTARESLLREIRKAITGQDEVVELVLLSLFVGGHSIITGVPGLAKTLLVRTIASVLDLSFKRIQFTPDLMPADITGTEIIEEDRATGRRAMEFIRGPVFANIVLADEINRTPPKTQAALLEAMQEGRVTVQGVSYELPRPFHVLATQNPIEMEGTYPLPEAQLDRFLFKLQVDFPQPDELVEILNRTTGGDLPPVTRVADGPTLLWMSQFARDVPPDPAVVDYAVRLVVASHPTSELAPPLVRRYARYGASPRGAQALVLAAKIVALLDGRQQAEIEDVRAVAPAALRHRVLLNFEGEAEGVTADALVADLIHAMPAAV
jgi:MoxR-like ATPase